MLIANANNTECHRLESCILKRHLRSQRLREFLLVDSCVWLRLFDFHFVSMSHASVTASAFYLLSTNTERILMKFSGGDQLPPTVELITF